MINIATFVGGNGSNFENIVQEIDSECINNVVCKALVIGKEHVYAKERAEKLHVPYVYINPKACTGKEPYEQKILNILEEYQVELIVPAGYMRFIDEVLLGNFPGRTINLHPAYLLNFPGAHSIQGAYEIKINFTGVTVRFVDKDVSTDEIIHQEKVMIDFAWSLEILEEYVHAPEHDMLPKVIKHVCKMIKSEGA